MRLELRAKLSLGILFTLLSFPQLGFSHSESTQGVGISPGQIRGVKTIATAIDERLFEYGGAFSRTFYKIFGSGSSQSSLQLILGSFDRDTGVYKGGTPNAVNIALWGVLFDETVRMIVAQSCNHDQDSPPENVHPVHPQLAELIKRLCPIEVVEADRLELLKKFWQQLMAFDGSYDDYTSFLEFYQSPDFWVLPPKERVTALIRGILDSPGFFLEP